jgi:hypothetical protein
VQGSKIDVEGDDPYVTLGEAADDSIDERIKPSDLLVLAAKTEEDSASLEVWLFEAASEEGDINAYVHHDIMLPAFPLCVAWMDFNPSGVLHSLKARRLRLLVPASRVVSSGLHIRGTSWLYVGCHPQRMVQRSQ